MQPQRGQRLLEDVSTDTWSGKTTNRPRHWCGANLFIAFNYQGSLGKARKDGEATTLGQLVRELHCEFRFQFVNDVLSDTVPVYWCFNGAFIQSNVRLGLVLVHV